MRFVDNKNLYEMARVGYYNDYEIYIRADDPGKIPHFYVRDSATQGKEFSTCIRIEDNRYFHHKGYMDVLNSKDRKDLVTFLNKISKFDESRTNWEEVIIMWNMNNSDVILNKDLEMPDYRIIKEG